MIPPNQPPAGWMTAVQLMWAAQHGAGGGFRRGQPRREPGTTTEQRGDGYGYYGPGAKYLRSYRKRYAG